MKKILFSLIIISGMFFPSHTFAQTKTPTRTVMPTNEEIAKINERVGQLKDKVASRVAQLKLVEKRGIMGIVENVTDTQITVNDLNNKTRLVDVDEFTKFSSSGKDSFGISDIKKGSKISALGLYNKESQRLLARFVNETAIPLFLNGVISGKDDDSFTITLSTEDGTNYIVDVEKVTKIFAYQEGELEVLGFTKIKKLENAIILGFADPKEKDRLAATQIITFPNLPKNPNIPIIEISPSKTPIQKVDGANN